MTLRTWLITGGAGYIGSHVAYEFLSNGNKVIIFDSFQGGIESRVSFLQKEFPESIQVVKGDICDSNSVASALEKFKPEGVIHTAALKSVSDSMLRPETYSEINYSATKNLLEILDAKKIKRFIFSSSAAVYGSPNHSNPVKEDEEKFPVSPYGESKLLAETAVEQFLSIPGNLGTSLRFFNVIGSGATELMDHSAENLVPIVIKQINSDLRPVIFGTNHATPDGTCVRDYVDVRDIARVHVLISDSEIPLPFAMNVGTGTGSSVREVIGIIASTFGKKEIEFIEEEPREGDPATLCADSSLIREILGFVPEYSLQESVWSLTSRSTI